ncbi:MAG: phytanoyl-CoA dioxygenase family protein, partial [Chloroflexota bacterium]
GTQGKKLISKKDYVKQDETSAFEFAMDRSQIDESEGVNLVLNPGDISIHHPNVFHGSNVNDSPRWRRGLTIRYIPTSTRITRDGPHPGAFIFRGNGYANGNGWNPLPIQNDETSMRFADQDGWNAKAAAANETYAEFLS